MKTNKELIDELKEYFLAQDPRTVAAAFAGTILDLRRMRYIEQLPEEEQRSLLFRVDTNLQTLEKFERHGIEACAEFILHRVTSSSSGDIYTEIREDVE